MSTLLNKARDLKINSMRKQIADLEEKIKTTDYQGCKMSPRVDNYTLLNLKDLLHKLLTEKITNGASR